MENKTIRMTDEEIYSLARKRVKEKREFLGHLISYVLVCTMLGILNYFFIGGYLWFKWVIFGWGIGIISHGVSLAYSLTYDVGAVDREVEKLRKKNL